MITISLCMIVKNEEDVIARCLDSVKDIADEIIIVDTGSTDHTKEIALTFTDSVFDFEWINDFSAARNYSYSKATMDYILILDADDVILEEDRVKFMELKQDLSPTVDVVMMKYNVGFDANGKVSLSCFRERISKRSKNFQWVGPVHEVLGIGGLIINSDICITHKKERANPPRRNLAIYEQVLANQGHLSPRGLYYYARELYENEVYDGAIEYFQRFLDTEEGWVEDNIHACYDLASCYRHNKDEKSALKILLKSFEFDTPRAEICCLLGYHYFSKVEYAKAIVWYKLATQLEKPVAGWGFILHACWDYIPNIQLCVCYDKLGKIKEAISYNEKAAESKPNDPSVAYNRRYFAGLASKQ